MIVYFRKEGRAPGRGHQVSGGITPVNARKGATGGGGRCLLYPHRVRRRGAGCALFRNLMPDVLHWLGITRIDRFISMSRR